ncbi:hypothetical protein ACQUSR_32990 [Streptomyces sp. P1-3]|uniref:hypothetical protein n=1 Tax=Streptomyces sp. P1-3 TaxID=3421658 RepID=UPI003D36B238
MRRVSCCAVVWGEVGAEVDLGCEEQIGGMSSGCGEVFKGLDGGGRDVVLRREEPVEEEAQVGGVQVRCLPAAGGRGALEGEQVVEELDACLLVAGGVAGGVVFEEGLVEEVDVACALCQ